VLPLGGEPTKKREREKKERKKERKKSPTTFVLTCINFCAK
jgi:hypothetical protein